jgi:hypothetical protein
MCSASSLKQKLHLRTVLLDFSGKGVHTEVVKARRRQVRQTQEQYSGDYQAGDRALWIPCIVESKLCSCSLFGWERNVGT